VNFIVLSLEDSQSLVLSERDINLFVGVPLAAVYLWVAPNFRCFGAMMKARMPSGHIVSAYGGLLCHNNL
jgi:hypothetical protein